LIPPHPCTRWRSRGGVVDVAGYPLHNLTVDSESGSDRPTPTLGPTTASSACSPREVPRGCKRDSTVLHLGDDSSFPSTLHISILHHPQPSHRHLLPSSSPPPPLPLPPTCCWTGTAPTPGFNRHSYIPHTPHAAPLPHPSVADHGQDLRFRLSITLTVPINTSSSLDSSPDHLALNPTPSPGLVASSSVPSSTPVVIDHKVAVHTAPIFSVRAAHNQLSPPPSPTRPLTLSPTAVHPQSARH
jgi:hypothetical protein